MKSPPTTVEKLRGLPWSIAGNAANAVFVQFTFFGSVFVLFLSELGLNKTQTGFVLSLLPFSAIVALLIAPAVARWGYKRTFLIFFGARKVATVLILLTPWVLFAASSQAVLIFVAGVVALFSLFRAVSQTAFYPWFQEYVPNSVRGKYTATDNIFTTVAALSAVAAAGYLLERFVGLHRFMLLIAAGVLFGFISVWAYAHIPGEAPEEGDVTHKKGRRDLREALSDRDFLNYLAGAGLITLATVPVVSFLPLFMQEQIGLSASNVVLLQTGALVGGLLSSYL